LYKSLFHLSYIWPGAIPTASLTITGYYAIWKRNMVTFYSTIRELRDLYQFSLWKSAVCNCMHDFLFWFWEDYVIKYYNLACSRNLINILQWPCTKSGMKVTR
jgi:hypothetical protein